MSNNEFFINTGKKVKQKEIINILKLYFFKKALNMKNI